MGLQLLESIIFILYRKGKLPHVAQATEVRNAWIVFGFLVAGFFNTLLVSLFFVLKQSNMYTYLTACCYSEFNIPTQNTCFGDSFTNGTVFMPGTCNQQTTWRTYYNQNWSLSIVYACFCGFQCASHHWNTSEVISFVKAGLIFRNKSSLTGKPQNKDNRLSPQKTSMD
ncbi:hypothetical protein BCR33DRAFT_725099, partial [Rhizoclosmatium globosum]